MSSPATRSLTAADRSLGVSWVRVTIHTMGHFFEDDERSGNHASIFLLTSDGAAVRLNMTKAGPTDTMGTLETPYCSFQSSNSSLVDLDVPLVQGLTVGHIIDLIFQNGRDRFKLHRSGVGCRYWVMTIMYDLERAGYIHSSATVTATEVHNRLRYNYSRGMAPVFSEIDEGQFVK